MISAYFYFLILENVIVTYRGYENAVTVIVMMNKIILYFST